MDVMEQEATEDFEKMAAMAPSEKPYLKTGVFSLAKNRILWLLVLMISGMITGGILGRYEAAIAAMPLLVTFIPMLTDTGGNAGSQSSTLVIRGMAVSDITLPDFPQVLWKELRVSLLVGVVLSAVNFVRLILTYPGSEMVALTVALTMLCTVIVAKPSAACCRSLQRPAGVGQASSRRRSSPIVGARGRLLSLGRGGAAAAGRERREPPPPGAGSVSSKGKTPKKNEMFVFGGSGGEGGIGLSTPAIGV